MKQLYYLSHIFFALCILASNQGCQQPVDAVPIGLGNLNVDKYLAFGDGISAGFNSTDISDPSSNMGLHEGGQQSCFPALLANQLSQIDPLIEFQQTFLPGNGSGFVRIKEVMDSPCMDTRVQALLEFAEPDPGWQMLSLEEPINHNFGIPRLSLSEIDNPDFENPFFMFIQSDTLQAQSYLDLVSESKATFFTLFIGVRDLLDYAIRGGADSRYPLIEVDSFRDKYNMLLNRILLSAPLDVAGIVGNLPDIGLFPYFNSIGHTWKDEFNCHSEERGIYIHTQSNGIRLATSSDKILLPASYKIGQPMGQGLRYGLDMAFPVSDSLVLDREEAIELRLRISELNLVLDSLVSQVNLARGTERLLVARIDLLVKGVSAGLIADGLDINAQHLSGGFFAVDGLYLTERGNAMVANEFIKAINNEPSLEAHISPLRIIDYPGVKYP